MKKSSGQPAQGMVEYSLVLALVAIAAIVILTVLGTSISSVFSNVICALQSSVCVGGPSPSPLPTPSPSPSPSLSYRLTVLSDSPSLYLPIDEGSGTTALDQVGTKNGTLGSASMWNATGFVNGSSNRIVGDPSGDVVKLVANNADNPGGNGNGAARSGPGTSFEIWFMTTDASFPRAQTLVDNWGGPWNSCGGSYDHLKVSLGTNETIELYDLNACAGGSTNITCTTNAAGIPQVRNSLPHYIAVTNDGINDRIYVDGLLCATSPVANAAVWSNAVVNAVGGSNQPDGAFAFSTNTFLGQAAWYAVVLTPSKISAHYAARNN